MHDAMEILMMMRYIPVSNLRDFEKTFVLRYRLHVESTTLTPTHLRFTGAMEHIKQNIINCIAHLIERSEIEKYQENNTFI